MAFPAALAHGPLEPVVDGVYAVRGSFAMAPGMTIGRTMTVVVTDAGLVVCNAIRLSPEVEAELTGLGPVKHLVKLSDSHGMDEPYYVDRFRPDVWVVPGSASRRISATRNLADEVPVPDGRVLTLDGISGWAEVALWVPHGGGTLVACDVLQNHCDGAHSSLLARLMTPMLGFRGGVIVAPMWRKHQKVQGEAVRRAMTSLLEASYENLVTGHGPAVVGGAGEHVRRAVDKASR